MEYKCVGCSYNCYLRIEKDIEEDLPWCVMDGTANSDRMRDASKWVIISKEKKSCMDCKHVDGNKCGKRPSIPALTHTECTEWLKQ